MNAPKHRCLIFDDDARVVAIVRDTLAGWDVQIATEADDFSAADAVVMEIDRPNGIELCRRIAVPVLVLSRLATVDHRVAGLEAGADDYMTKPFEPREFEVRLNALLRRSRKGFVSPVLRAGPVEIDPAKRTAFLDGKALPLTTAEFDALLIFVQHEGRPLSRAEIANRLKGAQWTALNRSIDILISRLRQKLGDDPKRPRFFRTVWGQGYVFLSK